MDCRHAKTTDPDEWLEISPEFSCPLAADLRERILAWEPDLTESIKWNNLCFSRRKLVLGLSACQKHLGVFFFRGTELPDRTGLFNKDGENNTNIRSIRFTTLEPSHREALRVLLRAAMKLDADPMIPPAPKVKREPWPVPDFFAKALKKDRAAAVGFARLSPTCQREYLVWLSTAKREETREKRRAQTLAALATGRKWIDRRAERDSL